MNSDSTTIVLSGDPYYLNYNSYWHPTKEELQGKLWQAGITFRKNKEQDKERDKSITDELSLSNQVIIDLKPPKIVHKQ